MKDELEILYKNLDHISKAYLSTQSEIIAWEAIFALVVGQIFLAFIQLNDDQRTGMIGSVVIILGSIFSLIWFAVFPKTQHYQRDRVRKLKKLEERIRRIDPEFLGYSHPDKDVGKIKAWHILKIIPVIFSIIWIFLSIMYPNKQHTTYIITLGITVICFIAIWIFILCLYEDWIKKWWLPSQG